MTTTTPKDSSNRLFMLAIVAIVVLGLLAVAFLAANRDGLGEIAEQQTDSVEISGDPIAPMPAELQVTDLTTDPAAGTVAPTLVGTDFLGNEVRIEADGRPKAIYFLAHWCPHCQEEVPVVQDLIDEGQLPEGLDVYGVSTAVDGSRGNFPPQAWLDRADFSPVVLRDDEAGSAFQAYGGSSFPYVVYLDGENRVIARSAGNLPGDSIVSLWESTVAAAPVE
ncbi:MAG: TlpA family protein disulfide reductase [Acidimicrobiales bacterium]